MSELLSFFSWSAQPEAFTVGPLAVRWYGITFALAFLFGHVIISWMFRVEGKNEKDLDRLFLAMVLGIIVGARLGHALFYDPAYYLSNPIEIVKIWRGGLASHGALVGGFLALYFYSRKATDQSYLWVLSRITVVAALGGSLVRIGNFFNSEIVGKKTQVAWAVVFEAIDRAPRHPSQLYESLAYLAVFLVLISIYRKKREHTPPRLLLGLYLVLTFSCRFLIEFTKEPQANFEQTLFLDMGQLLSLPLIGLGIYLLFSLKKGASGTI